MNHDRIDWGKALVLVILMAVVAAFWFGTIVGLEALLS